MRIPLNRYPALKDEEPTITPRDKTKKRITLTVNSPLSLVWSDGEVRTARSEVTS